MTTKLTPEQRKYQQSIVILYSAEDGGWVLWETTDTPDRGKELYEDWESPLHFVWSSERKARQALRDWIVNNI